MRVSEVFAFGVPNLSLIISLMRPEPSSSIVPKLWALPEAIRNRLGAEAGPQRAIYEEEHLLIILHQPPEPDEHGRRAALFWRAPDGVWKSNLTGNGIVSLQDFLKSYDDRLTKLEAEEVNASTATAYHTVLERLAPILRASRGLHRALQQARELARDDRHLITLRDQASAIERNAELLLQDAQFGLNCTVAKQAEAQAETARQMAKTAHRLNLMAAFFLPLTLLASIFGMDIHSQLADTPANFYVLCGSGLIGGIVFAALLSGRGK